MADIESLPMNACKICSGKASTFARSLVLKRFDVEYYRCDECGFVQTEEPYWLDEAYSDAITGSDTGLVSRNLRLARITQSVIWTFFNPSGRFLDYAGGYGLLVRLMRDAGYDFCWYDRYCHNLFAKGFEATPGSSEAFELVTAFEVLEHMRNPIADIGEVLACSRNVLFTTEIMPSSPPRPEAWWYYGLDHGQHISFFTISSLKIMALKLSLNFYTNGTSIHMFTEKKLSSTIFRVASLFRCASVISVFLRRNPLLMSDYAALHSITERRHHE